MPKLPEGDIPKVLELKESGLSLAKLGKFFGISTWQVVDILKSNGVDTARKKFTEEQLQKMEDMYGSGLSLKVIAKDFDISRGTLTSIFNDMGIQIDRKGRTKKVRFKYVFTEEDYEQLAKKVEEGESVKSLSVFFGVNPKVLSRRLEYLGLKVVSNSILSRYTEDQYLEMERLFKEGDTLETIGELFDAGSSSIWKILNGRGVSTKREAIYSDDLVQVVSDRYINGASLMDISRDVSKSVGTCRKLLLRNGVRIKSNGRKLEERGFSEEDIGELCSMYKEGTSVKNIAKVKNHAACTCSRLLRSRGIVVKDSARKYNFNEDFFEVIDTEAKAYWLGFIMADGNVNSRMQGMSIKLQGRDKGHLRKFLDDIEGEYPIPESVHKESGRKYCGVGVNSIKTVVDLGKWGVVPNKSLIATPPAFDIPSLERHFWRGAVDGDGWVAVGKNRVTGLCGSKNMVEGYLNFVKSSGIQTKTNARKSKNIYVVLFGGRQMAKKVSDLLYKDATVYLDRKFERYENFCREMQQC